MDMLQMQAIQDLTLRPVREGSPVLSVYLNLDPSDPIGRRGAQKLALDRMLKEIESQIRDPERLQHFRDDAEYVRQRIGQHLPKGKSIVVFCDVSESFFVEEDLPIRIASQAWFEETPYVRPLLQARDEHERYGIVLADRERARLFVLTSGDIEEVSDLFQSSPFKHRSAAGSDQMRSQMTFQRRAATWSSWFLKDVSDTLHGIIRAHDIDRIMLAGPEEVTSELHRLLPKTVASRMAGRLRMSVTARPREVLDVAMPVIELIEREAERDLVDDLVTMARKTRPGAERALLGFSSVLDAVNQGRVYQLIYPSSMRMKGYRCSSCDVLLDHAPEDARCPYCSKQLAEIDDVIWLASERVLSMGGRIEEIRPGDAQEHLKEAGGIGAFLR